MADPQPTIVCTCGASAGAVAEKRAAPTARRTYQTQMKMKTMATVKACAECTCDQSMKKSFSVLYFISFIFIVIITYLL
jgi:hypothetical protein